MSFFVLDLMFSQTWICWLFKGLPQHSPSIVLVIVYFIFCHYLATVDKFFWQSCRLSNIAHVQAALTLFS